MKAEVKEDSEVFVQSRKNRLTRIKDELEKSSK